MTERDYLLAEVADSVYALPLLIVEQALQAVAVQPLPQAPEVIAGLVNVHGTILPVMDLRRRFDLPAQPLDPGQSFIQVRSETLHLLLLVDAVLGVETLADADLVETHDLVEELDYVRAVTRTDDGMLLVCDVEHLLAPAEVKALTDAMDAELEEVAS